MLGVVAIRTLDLIYSWSRLDYTLSLYLFQRDDNHWLCREAFTKNEMRVNAGINWWHIPKENHQMTMWMMIRISGGCLTLCFFSIQYFAQHSKRVLCLTQITTFLAIKYQNDYFLVQKLQATPTYCTDMNNQLLQDEKGRWKAHVRMCVREKLCNWEGTLFAFYCWW